MGEFSSSRFAKPWLFNARVTHACALPLPCRDTFCGKYAVDVHSDRHAGIDAIHLMLRMNFVHSI